MPAHKLVNHTELAAVFRPGMAGGSWGHGMGSWDGVMGSWLRPDQIRPHSVITLIKSGPNEPPS